VHITLEKLRLEWWEICWSPLAQLIGIYTAIFSSFFNLPAFSCCPSANAKSIGFPGFLCHATTVLIARYKPNIPIEKHEHYHPEPLYRFDTRGQLYEGLKQIMVVTKSALMPGGLPERIQKLASELDTSDQDDKVMQVSFPVHIRVRRGAD